MKKVLATALIIICATMIMAVNPVYSNTERTYTVVQTYYRSEGGNIVIQAQSGNTYEVYYTSKIGVDVGDKVVVLFDSNDNAQRITNAKTSDSAAITSFSRR